MNNSNQAARYARTLPPGVHLSYPVVAAGAPNPYQTMRGAYPVSTPAFVAPQQQQPQQMVTQHQHPQQQVQQQVQQAQQQQQSPQSQEQQQWRGRVAVDGAYGLLALPGLIQQQPSSDNPETTSFSYLTRGFDLNSLGINVAQQRTLHPTLVSIAMERPEVPVVPEYNIPTCYRQAKPRQPTLKILQNYKDGTLLYIFYSMPGDLLQLAAARVLFGRRWWYHKGRQQWLRQHPAGGVEVFNQNTWKLEHEENFQLNPAELETQPAGPVQADLSAASANNNNSGSSNNNNNNSGGGAAAAAAETTAGGGGSAKGS